MSNRIEAKGTLERYLLDPNTKIETRGTAETATRRGVYLSCRLGLTSASFFVGVDPSVPNSELFVERVG